MSSFQLSQVRESFHEQLSRVGENFHGQLSSGLSQVRESFHQQLSVELSEVQESFHQQLSAKLQQIESVTVEELRRVKVTLEKQALSPLVESGRPQLRALPPGRVSAAASVPEGKPARPKETHQPAQQAASEGKFDARAFVFACLEMNPDLKLSEIEQLAVARGQELSQPTASRYRKQFFAADESSAMKGESTHESFGESSTMKGESSGESSYESSTMKGESAHRERKVVGQ